MSFGPVREARIDFSDPAAPRSPEFGDLYHPRSGPRLQAEHVFLHGSGLPQRWLGRSDFVVLELGFGLGNNFLTTWEAWRRDAGRSDRLWFISIERHPPRREDLSRAHAGSPMAGLADELGAAWPPATPDFHAIDLDQGRVRLLLVWADVAQALPELVASVDAFYLDGFAPDRNPAMWDPYTLRNLRRLAAPDATVATWSVAGAARDALAAAGFDLRRAPGVGGKREITLGHFAPRHVAPPPPGRQAHTLVGRQANGARHAVVIGGGMAGAAAAQALARLGVQTLVLDRRPAPAQETSGNIAGLFHGVVHGADGAHARWLRAAALRARHSIVPLIAQGRVAGQTEGLLRGAHEGSLETMQAMLAAQVLPPDWAEALSPEQATQRSGVPWSRPAWLFHAAGWVSPPGLVRHWLDTPGVQWRGSTEVHALRREHDEWQLLDSGGRLVASTPIVVLANAADAVRLLGHAPGPWERQRGQVSEACDTGHHLPLPLADGGYAIDAGEGRLLFGATSQVADDDPTVREADHLDNLASLQRLTGWTLPARALAGRTGWRMQTDDRLPWIGPAPMPLPPTGPRRDQPRFAPRQAGLYLLAGLGSRGLTHAPLAGELLAAWITGSPMPVPSRLIDAVDPARHAARELRQSKNRLLSRT